VTFSVRRHRITLKEHLRMKNILVTGANGFVGSHLLDLLVKTEPCAGIFALKRLNANMRNVEHLPDGAVTWLDGDLCDPRSMQQVVSESFPDEIYHLGALSWVTPSWKMPSAYMQTNAIGTIHLLDAIMGVFDGEDARYPRILISCTPEEFGDVDPAKLPLTEDSPTHPVNPYAASKLAQDAVCQVYHASYHMPIIRTRAFNHEGPRRDKHGALASFAYQIARIEAGLQTPIIDVGNLEAQRSFTHVQDMVRAYQLAMEDGIPGELYLIGSDNVYTIEQCLKGLLARSQVANIHVRTDPKRVRPTELRYLIGDCSKFRKLTGWKPEIGFGQMILDILEYWRKRVAEDQK